MTAENHQAAKNCGALESELVDILLQLKASDATVTALQQLNKQQQAELTSFRAKRNAALTEREAAESLTTHDPHTSTDSAPYRPVPPATIDAEPIYSITMTEYLHVIQNAAASLKQQHAERLALETLTQEVAAFRANRNAALAARDADGTLPVAARPLPADEAAVRALAPQEIADGPLYAVTLEEYRDKDAALEQLAAELDAQRADAQRLADEVAAFRANRNAALAARDADGTLPVAARPLPADEAAVRALAPQEIADGPLYAVTLEEYRDKDAALEQLAAELDAQRADAQRLADEVAAFRANRNAALAARDADGTLPVAARPLPADEAAVRALAPQEIADGPLYAVTLEELQQVREDAIRSAAAIDDNAAAVESELLDVLAQLKALEGENAALVAVCGRKDAAVADLEKHDVRAQNSDKSKPQTSSRHQKVFEGDEWDTVVETRPHALHDAFVMDVCTACRVCREDLSDIRFALGSLQASVTVTHNSEISCDDIAKLVEEYHYPNVWSLYGRRSAPKDGLDEARDTISMLEGALAAQRADAQRLADELDAQRADAQRLADEVAAFRANRNAALAARDADGTLPVAARPLPADEAAVRALAPQEIADGPLYAVTLEEYRDKDAALEQLAAELDAQRADAQRLADEVAAFRANRNAALAARDADGTLPVAARPLPADEAAVRALAPQEIADGPLYAVTLEEYRDKDAALEQLAAELDAQRADAQRLADEVAAFRANRNAALAARDADGTLPVAARPLPADEAAVRALAPQEIADGPLYAVTLEEYRDKDAALEQLAAELDAQRADAQRLADEVAAFRANRNAALAARDADGTLPVAARPLPADEAAVRALAPQEIADGPLYAVTLEEYRDKDAALEQLAAELDAQRADAQRLADEVAAFRANRNAALAARDADGTLPVAARPLPADEAAVRALAPQEIADGPLYAVTLEEYRDKDAALEQLAAELDAQRADAQRLADEVAALRTNRNAALAARDADGTLPVAARPLPADEAAVRALAPQEIADGPLYAVTLEEYRDKDAALEQLAAELDAQRADAQRLADEVAAFRANRNAALAARDADGTLPVAARPLPADEAAVRALAPQEIADGPLYAVTLEEYRDKDAALEQLAAELDAQRADAQRLADEVAAFRANRNAALAARDADGTLPVAARPLPADEAAVRALAPQEIADGPLYAVTLEEYRDKDAALEQLAAELDAQRADAQRLADEVAAFRANRNAALAARDADGTLPVAARPLPADEAAVRALAPQEIADGPLYAVTLEEYRDKDAALEQLAAELDAQRADAQRLADEVAAFRANRNAALAARDADGTLPVAARPLPADEAAVRALAPQEIADGPLYAVTLEEYRDKDAALEQLAAELDAQRADAQRLADEVAAFRANRNAALAARDADGTLPVAARPLPADEAAVRALAPQEIADGPLYAVTLEEYRDKDAALEQLAAELDAQRADAQRLADEVAAFRANRNAALAARDADGTLPVAARPLPADEAAVRALAPQEIADGPLYAVTLEELQQVREDAIRSAAAIDDNAAAVESELLDVLAQLKALEGENAALVAFCGRKDAAVADLEKHDVRAQNSDKSKPQTSSRHQKVFEGDEWDTVVETRPHALHDAFVMDVCTACRVCREDLSDIRFALGSLQASVTVTHNSEISCDDIAKLVEEYHYPNVWSLYGRRSAPKDGLDEARDTISMLEGALAAQRADAQRLADELDAQRADAQRLADEVAAFRANRNAALAARDADGTLPVAARPLPADEAAVRALAPQEIADGPLYAVTLEEYRDKDAALEQLAAELDAQRADAQRLADEVAAFRANRNAALAARDADGTLPVAARPLPADEAAVRALAPQEIADGPLYAVTLEELQQARDTISMLEGALAAQRADAQRLADEVAAFRTNRNAALAARDADGTLPVAARPLPADEAAVRALAPQEIADGPLYAVTLEEYRDKDAALEQLAAELDAQRADAQRLADEVAAFRANRNAALAARDADGTLPVAARPLPADEAAVRALAPQEIADGPLYAVTLEEYRDKDAALEQLAAELDAQRADAQRLADEVAAFRANRNAALAARDADGTLPVAARPLPADEAAVRALAPQEIADGPLYAVTLEELQQVREDAIRSAAAIDDNAAAVESELLDVLAQLKALEGENAALVAFCGRKDAAVADLEKHDVRAQNSDKSKPQTSSRHQKVFEGDEWDTVVETRPHALHDAFVMDVCTACRVCREDLSDIRFALGSLQASVTVTHNSEISCDDIAKLVEEYHYPNVWSLYGRRSAPKDGLDEARDTISMLEGALAAQRADAQRLADELDAQRADAQRLADEVAAFRANRNAALAARDADGTLPVAARPLPADEAAVRALAPQEIADGPLYAVTLEEYRDKDAALEQLAAELDAQRADAQRLADEVAAFRANRNAALAARDADGTLPVAARPLPADEAAVRALAPQEIADGPLYAVTLEEYRDKDAALEQLAAELDAQRADAQRLADEVAAFRANRNAALAARDADGTLPVAARPLPADEAAVRALAPQEIADGPLYAVTLEEYRDKDAALEQLAAELDAQRADAQRLADEVAAFRANRNAALAARDADGTLPVAARPLPADEAAVRALAPQEIADGPLYAVTLEEYRDKDAALEQLAAELDAQRADAQRLADEVAAFRANRNAALAARDADGTLPVAARPLPADEAAVRALAPQEIADGPLYAVTLEEYRDKDAALEQLAAELDAQRADAQRLADEVAAFRTNRNAALAARDADGTLPVAARPLPADEAAVRALAPQEIADGPLYAVTLEEYRDKDAALEQLAAELDAQRADAQRLADEVAAFRANRNAALAARDADGTLPVAARPLPADEAAVRALAPQEIADGPLYAVTLEEYRDKDAALEQLAAELDAQRADAQRLADEVAAFRTNRNAALAARDADGTLPVAARPLPADEAAVRALAPQEIADGPLYAVTLEEYRDKDAALEQLAAELDAQRADAQRLADEVAAFRANRNAALAARDADGTLPVAARPLPADEAAVRALAPQEIADGPLYAVTLEEYRDKDAALEQLAAELDAQRADAQRLADEVAAFRANRNAALAARDADGTLPVAARPLPADEAAVRALAPQEIADGPLYAVTLEELQQVREDAIRSAAAIDDNAAAVESELLDVLAQLKALEGENAALVAFCGRKDAAVADLEKHDVRAQNSDKSKPQTSSRHQKVFEGDEWDTVVETRPHALHDAFVMDVCTACRVCREDLSDIRFALGSLQASVTVTHNSEISCDDIAKLVEEYHYPNVWSLYGRRSAPKDGLDEARDTISMLEGALAAQRADAQRLADEVAAFRTNRNAALAARDADGTLPVAARPLPADEAAVRALAPQEIADGPLYAVTLEEYRDKDAALEQLAAELDAQRADAQRLADEVAAFRANRNAALAARDADGTLPVAARPLPADEAAVRALAPQEIADGPLYAVTLEEYRDKDAALEQLAAELDAQRADAQRLADEVAAFRANRNAALAARDADGTLPVAARPLPADEAAVRALAPQEIADGPLYAVTLEEYRDKDAALEQLAAELDAQRADAQRLADEVAAFRTNRNAALAARDADGTLPVAARPLPADEAAVRALAPQEIADGPLYAVTLEEYRDKDAALEQLAAELDAQRADAQRLADEVAAFRANRNAALAARDADGTLPVAARPLPADEAAVRALAPQEIADGPLYAVTLEEYRDKDAALEQLAAELDAQRADAQRLADEVAAFRTNRNAALAARDADGTLPVAARPLPADEAAVRALAPQEIADGPLYAVTLEEYRDKDAALEQLAAELDAQRADAQRLADEVAAFRANRNAALAARDADGTLPVAARPLPADEAAVRALAPQEIADGPLYAVTLEEYRDKDAALEQLAAELDAQRADAQRLADEVAAFRTNRNAALAARDADGTLPVAARPLPADEAAVRALAPQEIADGPLYAVTLEEYRDKDAALEQLAAELDAQRADAQRLADEVAAFRANRNAALAARDADGTLPVAARPLPADEAAVRALAPQEIADGPLYAVTLEEYRDKDAALEQLAAELDAQRADAQRLADEVAAFRANRNAALAARDADGTLPVAARPLPADEAAVRALAPQEIADGPLYAVTLVELSELRDLNAAMVEEFDALAERVRAALDPKLLAGGAGGDVVFYLETLLAALEQSRGAEQAARDVAEERERELLQLRKLCENEEERFKCDLEEAREEVERLQGELDLLTDKLDEACRLFGDADAVNAEGVAKLEAFAEVLAAARDAERDAVEQLEAKESELLELRIALRGTVGREEALEKLEDEVALLQKEKGVMETELSVAQKEMNDLRHDLRAAEDRAEDKTREVERMTLDLDALNIRIKDLLEELEEKTDQYNQVIRDLDDFAKNQSRGDEKELLQQLAAREQELFELLEARRGENDEHEKQVGVLQDQINRLRDQTEQDNALHDGLQGELARLRQLLADTESALREKTAENESLRDDIEGMVDEHEAQMCEMEQELEGKSKEVSEALERLEEMSAMVQEAREGEESALRLRADADAEVFRLQKELDKMKQLQSAMAESGDDKGRLLAQMLDTEGQLRDAEATIRKKDVERGEVEKEWREKLKTSEGLNVDLRRLLKQTMSALSKSRDTMGNSAGALDAFRDELKPMLQ
ncbi:hypothetical protein CUR178_01545 [Leishmania enriettii]|uniref:Flagellar attachment zone protein 1 conserved domain-containing protein n=1 Tax=Leishmania enriettii TaxID=5663 RepID=A0A836KFB7_LEIEN|nr:hypothetical protein CUR178_01545 [Leishmania enriettii]